MINEDNIENNNSSDNVSQRYGISGIGRHRGF